MMIGATGSSGRRLGGILVAVALVVSACSSAATTPPATVTPPASQAPVTQAPATATPTAAPTPLPSITVWFWPGPEGDAMKASAAEYTKVTGNPLDFQILGRDTWMEKRTLYLTGGGTGVCLMGGDDFSMSSFAATGALAPIDEYLTDPAYQIDDMLQGPKDASKFDGKTYMFPTDFSTELLFYRTDLIPTPPKTWDEYLAVAKQFTQSVTPASPTKYGTVYSGKGYISEASWLMLLWDWGGDLFDADGKVTIDSQAAIDSLDYHLSLVTKYHVVPPETPNWEYPEIQVALQQGLVAMASQFNAAMPDLQDPAKSPKTAGKIALTALPAGPQGQWTGAEMLGLWLTANCANKDAAAAFATWLTGPEGGLFYSKAGGNSPRTSVFNDPGMQKLRPWNQDLLQAMQHSKITMTNQPKETELLTILRNEMNKALAGQQDAKTTLTKVAAQWRQLLGQ